MSCKSVIHVEELCIGSSIIEGEYIPHMEVLHLLEDNEPGDSQIDTMYFKVDKKTKNLFKLENRAAYEANIQNEDYDVEKYVFLQGPNNTGAGWQNTVIHHQTPKYSERIKGICDKDVDNKIIQVINKQLKKKGYTVNLQESSNFEGAFKETIIQYQKDNNLPYRWLDLNTLNSLNIKVKEKSHLSSLAD